MTKDDVKAPESDVKPRSSDGSVKNKALDSSTSMIKHPIKRLRTRGRGDQSRALEIASCPKKLGEARGSGGTRKWTRESSAIGVLDALGGGSRQVGE